MKKIVSILIFIALCVLTSCSQKEVVEQNYIYKGENDSWSAEYKVDSRYEIIDNKRKNSYEGKSDNMLKVTYKKDLSNLSLVKEFEITYETSRGGGTHKEEFSEANPIKQKTFIHQSSSSGVKVEGKNEIIKVIIKTDEKTEEINLKSVK